MKARLSCGLVVTLLSLVPGCIDAPAAHLLAGRSTRNFARDWSGKVQTDPASQATSLPIVPVGQVPGVSTPVGPAPSEPAVVRNKLIAVLDIRSRLKGADLDAVDPGYLGNSVRTGLKRAAPSARVMTRENVLVLLAAAGKKLEDCEGECEIDTARRLGADLVISGEVLRVGSRLKLELRLHETREGQLLAGASASGKDVDELDAALGGVVRSLLDELR